MTNKRAEKILTDVIQILKKQLNPPKIILFGSRAKTKEDTHSDFDIAVDMKRPVISVERKIKEEIENVSGLYKVDIIYLQTADTGFREIVNKTGKVIYERRT